jgi:RHS repeat-associated protein
LTPGSAATVSVVATDGSGNTRTNHYQESVPSEPTYTPTYDADGNELTDGAGRTFKWDAKNELASVISSSGTATFTYDALSHRISESDGGTLTKQWVWDGGTMAEERNSSNTVTKRFYGLGEQISGTSYYYTRDHLGSVREMTDGGGTIHARYDYDPYGRAKLISGSLSSDFQYAGYYAHQLSGLNLTKYRAYDPNTTKWLSRDPLGESFSPNLYGYVDNNPVVEFDPLGLNPGDLLPSGAGLQITATVDVGIPTGEGMVMAGATGSLGLGSFYNSDTGQRSSGSFNSAGTFQNIPGVPPSNYPSSGGYPNCPQTPFALGAHAGFGPGVFITNAGNVNDLTGPFNQYNLNLFLINISLGLSQDSHGITTYIVGVSLPNAGLAISGYPTTTAVISNSAPPPSGRRPLIQ